MHAIDAGAIGGTAIVSQEVHGVRLRTYSFDHAGIVTIALENGQVWKQIESDSNFAHWHAKPDTYVARITKGFWGSFDLKVSNDEKLYEVRRVK
jgi:hypothetical protein